MTDVAHSTSDTRPSAPAIVVDHVDISYRIYAERQRSLRRLLSGDVRQRSSRQITAVTQASLAIRSGESVGVIGHNGSGKTSLLRAIGGLVPVTSGAISVRSTPVLLGVRAALEGKLSARANVFLGGTALGIPKAVLRARFDEIIEFAGVEEHVDVPIRAFSAGMRARLQFAIATATKPEIMLIDEALSVGDAEFKQRADERIRDMVADAGAMMLVSHSRSAILDLCERVIWLHQGRIIADGPAEAVVEAYARHVRGLKVPR